MGGGERSIRAERREEMGDAIVSMRPSRPLSCSRGMSGQWECWRWPPLPTPLTRPPCRRWGRRWQRASQASSSSCSSSSSSFSSWSAAPGASSCLPPPRYPPPVSLRLPSRLDQLALPFLQSCGVQVGPFWAIGCGLILLLASLNFWSVIVGYLDTELSDVLIIPNTHFAL